MGGVLKNDLLNYYNNKILGFLLCSLAPDSIYHALDTSTHDAPPSKDTLMLGDIARLSLICHAIA